MPGESVVVMPGVWHSFGTDNGVVFEEISSRDYDNDSFYEDKSINKLARAERKTVVDHWGRFQLTQPTVQEDPVEVTDPITQ